MHSSAAEASAGSANPAIPITAAAITATPNLPTPYSSHDNNRSALAKTTASAPSRYESQRFQMGVQSNLLYPYVDSMTGDVRARHSPRDMVFYNPFGKV